MAVPQSPITNCWGSASTQRLEATHTTIHVGKPGLAYSHQAQLTSVGGRLYASWSLGIRDEEAPGQTAVFAVSDDEGESWSDWRIIALAERGEFADKVVVNSGLRSQGEHLIAYYGEYEYDQNGVNAEGIRTPTGAPRWDGKNFRTSTGALADIGPNAPHWDGCHIRTRTRARVSPDHGSTWSDPIDIFPRIATYHRPEATKSGRLILPGHATFPFTDDPAGLKDWTYSALVGLPPDFSDDTMGWRAGREARKDTVVHNEGSFFQTDDGIIHMMLRTESPRLWVAESADDGTTWAEPKMTAYTDNVCRPHFGRLADGRYFGMTCPDPATRGARTLAVLALSKDGTVFDRHFIVGDAPDSPPRQPGLFKHGRFGYPYFHNMGPWGFVIYSVSKEDIAVARFRIDQIE